MALDGSVAGNEDTFYIASPSGLVLPTSGWSIAFWHNQVGGGEQYGYLFGCGLYNTNDSIVMYENNNDAKVTVLTKDGSGASDSLLYNTYFTDAPAWHLLVLDYDGTTHRLYKDTTVVQSGAYTQSDTIDLTTKNLSLTNQTAAGAYKGHYYIAELGIWDRSLYNTGEIDALANGYAPQFFRNGLILYWPLNDRDQNERINGFASTGTNRTNYGTASHPGIIYPRGARVYSFAAAAADTIIDVPSYTVAYTMAVPTVATGVGVDVPSASVAYTLAVPTVATGAGVDVPAASVSYTMVVPEVATGVGVDVPSASVSYTLAVPEVAAGVGVDVPAASIAYSLNIPTVIATTGVIVDVPAASIAYTLQTPTVVAVTGATIDVPSASVAYQLNVPEVATGAGIDVPAATIAYALQVPTVDAGANTVIDVPAALVAYALALPEVATGAATDVPAGSIEYAFAVPSVFVGQDASPTPDYRKRYIDAETRSREIAAATRTRVIVS